MPELPDITVYVERLLALAGGQTLRRLEVLHPFLLRTAVPPVSALQARTLEGVERLGKRVVLAFDGGLLLVIHLMIAGRLVWQPPGAKALAGKLALARFEFDSGTLVLTEAGTQRRASLHLLQGRAALEALDPGGIDVLANDAAAFAARLRA